MVVVWLGTSWFSKAVIAAIEQFLRDTAPPPADADARPNPWLRAGLFEATKRDPAGPAPWGDPHPWGQTP